ncbi:MAG TPA: FAD-dependent oxidoreductase [Gemmataceae bacterium]|nr:FAD-dependent oxidoreductase [Gemmataceae bacterium]
MPTGGKTEFHRRQVLQAGVASIAGAAVAPTLVAAAQPVRVQKWDQEFDVIIVGFGVSGGAAAHEAVRAGVSVLVLDRASAAANESHGGVFYLGGGTKLKQQLGVKDTPEDMAKFLTALYQPAPAEDKIRAYCERSPEHYDWLAEVGLPFGGRLSNDSWPSDTLVRTEPGGLFFSSEERSYPFREIVRPAQRGHMAATGSSLNGGKVLQKLLLDATRKSGATQLLAADAQRLAIGADGRVDGVLAQVDGVVKSFRARRGVILATGGFANNRDMVALYTPQFLDNTPIDVGANDGWGHRAALAGGAVLERMDGAVAYFNLYPPLSRKDGILVNAQGQRFVYEDAYYGHIGTTIVRTQRGIAHLILDAPALNGIQPDRGRFKGDSVAAQANTIAEIERAIGIPEPALQRTVEIYNHYAAKGEDPFFHKEKLHVRPLDQPPFTALKASVKDVYFPFFTLGGLSTNARAEVLNGDGNPISGLYAAGRVAAGISTPFYHSTGLSLGEGTFFGRVAGLAAAANSG